MTNYTLFSSRPPTSHRCEINLIRRFEPYCDKKARWTHCPSGYLVCGEHKRKIERERA